jgi:tetratricopeptide (TPR) repeat protein
MLHDFSSVFKNGLKFFEEEEWRKAIDCFSRAVKLDPNNSEVHYYLGQSLRYDALKRYSDEDIQSIVALPWTVEEDGISANDVMDEAIVELYTALELNDRDDHAHLIYGNAIYERLERQDHGTSTISSKAPQRSYWGLLSPVRWDGSADDPYIVGERRYDDESLLNDVIEQYLNAIQINPSKGIYHHNLAVAYHDQGKTDKAIEELQQALRAYNNYSQYRDNIVFCRLSLAELFARKGSYDRAINEYEQILQLYPISGEDEQDYNNKALEVAYLNLGILLQEQQKYTRAIEVLEEAENRNLGDDTLKIILACTRIRNGDLSHLLDDLYSIDAFVETLLENPQLDEIFEALCGSRLTDSEDKTTSDKVNARRSGPSTETLTRRARAIERKLRSLIHQQMSNEDRDYWKNLVNNAENKERQNKLKLIKETAEKRLYRFMVSNPAKSKREAIDYISLGDSSYIILSYWSLFKDIFKEESTFNIEMNDLASLRNPSAHNNRLTTKEKARGYAAILYFEGIFKDAVANGAN